MKTRWLPTAACALILLHLGACAADEPANVRGDVQHTTVTWERDGTRFIGDLYRGDATAQPSVGVVVYPEWWGINTFAREQAHRLASQTGVTVLVADLYGEARSTTSIPQAVEWATELREDPALWRARARAAVDALKAEHPVDRIMVMGFCYGGTTALHMGFASADIQRAVSFHGNLPVPMADDPLRAGLLVLHGEADPLVPPEEIAAFVAAMNDRRADWTMISYGHAVHSFTNPAADGVGLDGVAYQREAEQRSWAHMLAFLEELR